MPVLTEPSGKAAASTAATPARRTPALSVFDYVVIGRQSSPGEEIRARLSLARALEDRGVRGYWFAEHHLGGGRASSAPGALVAMVAAQTRRLEVGAAVAVLPHHRPLTLVETFGTIAAAFPGRIHLGIGRGADYSAIDVAARVDAVAADLSSRADDDLPQLELGDFHALLGRLAQASPADPAGYERSAAEVLSLLRRPIATIEGAALAASPGHGAQLTAWHFSSGSPRSAAYAAANGLPYAISHHVGAAAYIDSVAAYREQFVPSRYLEQPRVAVSVHALTAPTRAEARTLADAYPAWFSHVLRRGFSERIPEPGAPVLDLTAQQRATLDASLAIRIVGEPTEVVDRVAQIAQSVRADDVLVNTIAPTAASHGRSHELLATAWHDARSHAERSRVQTPTE